MNRIADISIGGLGQHSNRYDGLVPTTAYYHDDITWCLSAPNPYPQWMNFYAMIGDVYFPLAGFFSFFVMSGLVYALTANSTTYKPLNYHEATFIIYGMILNMTTIFKPEKWYLKLGYFVGTLCCLIMNNIVLAYYTMLAILPYFPDPAGTSEEIRFFRSCGEASTYSLLTDGKMVKTTVFFYFFQFYPIDFFYVKVSERFHGEISDHPEHRRVS